MGWLTFERLDRLTPGISAHWRARLFHRLPRRWREQAWDALREQLRCERCGMLAADPGHPCWVDQFDEQMWYALDCWVER